MEKIWEFFENINEHVYVSDMDTYELIYMNKKSLETYGYHSLDEVVGRKCYEVLQNCSVPCAICKNHNLVPGHFTEWRYYHPILGRYLILKDTMTEEDGRRCHIEFALDMSPQEWQSNVLHNYENLEAQVNSALRIALQAPTPDESIQIIIEYLGKMSGGDRAYIFEKNQAGCDDNTYEWVTNGGTSQKSSLQNLPPQVCAGLYRNFRENRHIAIQDLEIVRKEDPLLYKALMQGNTHSLVIVPLYDEKEVIGFYGVDNPPKEFIDSTANMLQIMGHFIVSSIRRRNLVRELEQMSYTDQLTKLGNRYAMNRYISEMKYDESIGVVYSDVTGLKHVNDTEGHEAGDRLILRACESLRRVFGDYGVFRIGGDELLVLCARIDQETLQEKVELLRKDLQEHSVNMAVGAVWQMSIAAGIDKLLSESEKLMYKDKAAYYKATGRDRRK